jgi:hypothetical protein
MQDGIILQIIQATSRTEQKVDDFIAWSKNVHEMRETQVNGICEKVSEHDFWIRIIKWALGVVVASGSGLAIYIQKIKSILS